MRISDWSSDVCSSDLAGDRIVPKQRNRDRGGLARILGEAVEAARGMARRAHRFDDPALAHQLQHVVGVAIAEPREAVEQALAFLFARIGEIDVRSEEHTSELQSLMRISYAVFCLKKKIQKQQLA